MANIRALLAEVTAQDVSLHTTLLEELRNKHDHTISPIATEGTKLPEEFMCFEYALGLAYSEEYLVIRESEFRTRIRPIGANEEFMCYLLDLNWLEEVVPVDAHEGDLIVYFNDCKPAHAGVVADQGRVISKWGRGLLVEHELLEAPAIYGNEVRYYRALEIGRCEDAFIEYAESRGREFSSEIEQLVRRNHPT